MKIRWNWGTGIFVASVAFMLMIVIFVIFMFRQNFDLVENDYYPKALEYQQKIDKTENSRLLAERVKTEKVNGTLFFTFPSFFYPF
ncbi:MAG: cytochrome C oxidase Cbb3, partial [Bacteroidetes bacterium]|nr:cytochrome C oxidase Cbb3 [Bacteroidota bacterium]